VLGRVRRAFRLRIRRTKLRFSSARTAFLTAPARPGKDQAGKKRAGAVPLSSSKSGDPLDDHAALLPTGKRRTVVVIAGPGHRYHVQSWLSRFADDDLHVMAEAAEPEWPLADFGATYHQASAIGEQASELMLIGPVDVMVNLLEDDQDAQLQMWRRFLYHLAPNGLYIIDRRWQAGTGFTNSLITWMGDLADAEDPEPKLGRRTGEYLRSTSTFVVTRDLILVKKRLRHFLKVQHNVAHKVLSGREPDLQIDVLSRLPRGTVRSAAKVNLHESSTSIEHILEQFSHPELVLRHYRGQIAFLGSTLFYTGSSILPDAFRHYLSASPANPRLISVSPSFARLPADKRATKLLPGNYYNLDSAYTGHFGHLTTEVVSRLWGWDAAKAAIPDLKAIVAINYENQRDPTLERRLFGAYGIAADDIVCVDRPVLLESLVSAMPMWHNAEPHFVHPGMVDVWKRLTDGLLDPAGPVYDRVFVSRGRHLKRRACRNSDDVERFFAEHGFTVIYPEELDLGAQVRIFASAKVIAGFGGSGLFNIMHARQLETLIVLSHESYTARNEHLFTALLGATVHYFWSAADIAHEEGEWSSEAFMSEWEFDFARNRADLEKVFAGLG
jgi:capsular polysaccharide biosynthesis protein